MTLTQRYAYTPGRNFGWPNIPGYRLANNKSGKMALMSDIMLMVTLLMMLLEYSDYTSKKRESAHFEGWHQTRGAMVENCSIAMFIASQDRRT